MAGGLPGKIGVHVPLLVAVEYRIGHAAVQIHRQLLADRTATETGNRLVSATSNLAQVSQLLNLSSTLI